MKHYMMFVLAAILCLVASPLVFGQTCPGNDMCVFNTTIHNNTNTCNGLSGLYTYDGYCSTSGSATIDNETLGIVDYGSEGEGSTIYTQDYPTACSTEMILTGMMYLNQSWLEADTEAYWYGSGSAYSVQMSIDPYGDTDDFDDAPYGNPC